MNSIQDNLSQFPFKGIVAWSVSVNLHTDMVYRELAKYIDVVLCVQNLEFRSYGKIDLGNIRVRQIKSVDDFPKETLSGEYLHLAGAPKRFGTWNAPVYECCMYALKHGCPVMSLNVEQYPWWEGLKGLARRAQWFWAFNSYPGRKLRAIGCHGESGVKAYRKSFVKPSRLFEYIYAPPRLAITPPIC